MRVGNNFSHKDMYEQTSGFCYLGEGGGSGRHEDLTDAVVEARHRLLIDAQETLRRALLRHLVLQVPDAVLVRELLVRRATLRQDAALEAAHVEQQVGVIFAVHRHKAVLPLNRRHRPRQPVLNVPKHCATPVNIS